ncbi:MAG: hypothetical protein WDZ83_07865 [Rhizobiaceae bacterium]
MIKFAFAAIWIGAVALGSVYYSFSNAKESHEGPNEPSFFGGLDYVKTGVVSVPVFKDGRVHGYFLGRLVFTIEPDKLKALIVPAEALIIDQLYAYLYANPDIDFHDRESLDLDRIKNGLRDSVNERVGDKLVHDVLIEQVDFLSKTDIRDNTIRRRSAQPLGKNTKMLSEDEAGDGGGH